MKKLFLILFISVLTFLQVDSMSGFSSGKVNYWEQANPEEQIFLCGSPIGDPEIQ